MDELGHCDHLFWLAEKDMPERGVVKGEPYCAKCPGIPIIGTHCCLKMNCRERIAEANKRFEENWKSKDESREIRVLPAIDDI